MKHLVSKLFITAIFLVNTASQASLLTGGLNVDNSFNAYISTDNSVKGSLIGSGHDWTTTIGINPTTLVDGQDYFLHIAAQNHGGPAGFLGDFSLTGSDHVFANNSDFITTNTLDWMVSTTGWSNYDEVYSHGVNGVSPWGTRSGVVLDATWIWTENYVGGSNHAATENVFFTLAIYATNSQAVPEPSIIALMGLGLVGLGLVSRRKYKV